MRRQVLAFLQTAGERKRLLFSGEIPGGGTRDNPTECRTLKEFELSSTLDLIQPGLNTYVLIVGFKFERQFEVLILQGVLEGQVGREIPEKQINNN